MPLPLVSGEFRMVDDPELRFTPSGAAVSNFRLVADQQKKTESGDWVDDKILWISASCWRQMAENVAESLRKGDLVTVRGKIQTREYTTRDGDKRSVVELLVDDIGPSLRFRSVLHADGKGGKVTREGAAPEGQTPDADNDPWAAPTDSSAPPF